MDTPYAIEMLHITKRFPGIIANDDITLQVKKGEIHALLGENGAGKSTLMSVLFGLYQPEEGIIKKDGVEVSIKDPNDANALGIGMVHQHFKLVECFTVLDNIIMGVEPTKHGFLQKAEAREKVLALSEKYGLHVDPDALIEDITVGMQQRTEILKMLYRENEILIFDEPTAVLTPQEIDELMQIMRGLTKEGKSILFISHKLNEIMEITDRLTIMRGGRSMGVYNTCDVTKEEISRLMVGRDVILNVQKDEARPTDTVLRVRDLEYVNEWHKKMLDKISFDVRRGEILGIAGVEGNGQKEMVDMLFGFLTPNAGSVTVQEENILGLPQQMTGMDARHIGPAPDGITGIQHPGGRGRFLCRGRSLRRLQTGGGLRHHGGRGLLVQRRFGGALFLTGTQAESQCHEAHQPQKTNPVRSGPQGKSPPLRSGPVP